MFELKRIFNLLKTNNKEISDLLSQKTEIENLEIYREFIQLSDLEYCSYSEKIKIAIKYLETEMDNEIYILLTYKKLLINRTCDERIKLVNKYLQSKKDPFVYYLIINEGLLETKTFEEQMALINKYLVSKEEVKTYSSSDKNLYGIITMLCKYDINTISKTIDKYLVACDREYVYDIVEEIGTINLPNAIKIIDDYLETGIITVDSERIAIRKELKKLTDYQSSPEDIEIREKTLIKYPSKIA